MAAEGWKTANSLREKSLSQPGRNVGRTTTGEGDGEYLCYDSVIYDNEFAPFDWMEFGSEMGSNGCKGFDLLFPCRRVMRSIVSVINSMEMVMANENFG